MKPIAASGRRAADQVRSRLDLATVLSLVLPAATLGALLLVRSPSLPSMDAAPDVSVLDRFDLGCPAALDTGAPILIGSASDGTSGEVEVIDLDQKGDAVSGLAPVSGGAVTEVKDADGPVLVTGRDTLAPGLLATRVESRPLAAVPCSAPTPDRYFAGLGARAGHSSVISLDNPDVGAAVVDITVYSRRGELDVADVRGLRVPGRTSLEVDLASTIPRRGDVGVRVSVSRGRAAVSVVDEVGLVDAGVPAPEWLPGQDSPAVTNLVLGLVGGAGPRTLSILNPGASETQVTLSIVAPESVFTPAGVKEITVGPGALVSVSLDKVLKSESKRGAIGLLVESDLPVAASLSSYVGDDLVLSPSAPPISEPTAVLLPRGKARLVFAGAESRGTVKVVAFAADGSRLAEKSLQVAPDRGQELALPRGASYVEFEVDGTAVSAAVVVEGDGSTVIPVTGLQRFGLVPAVRPVQP